MRLRADRKSDFSQWFHFRVCNAAGRELVLKLTQLESSAYPAGWPGYRACVSEDRSFWGRADTSYDKGDNGGTLTVRYTPASDIAYFAYFAPYSLDRHHDLVAEAAAAEGVSYRRLGETLDGRALDCLELGSGEMQVLALCASASGRKYGAMVDGRRAGIVERPGRPCCASVAQQMPVHIVPNCNPDGSFRGHLRTNADGTNLDREWATPSAEASPEVLAIRNAMDEAALISLWTCMGMKRLPAVFSAGFEGIPSWTDEQGEGYYRYQRILERRTTDFQTAEGLSQDASGQSEPCDQHQSSGRAVWSMRHDAGDAVQGQ